MKRTNRGWIYYTRSEGMQDAFYVSSNATGEVKGKFVGHGIIGSENAVAYFEDTLKLGPIKLEPYGPLGLRVYTEEEEVGDISGPYEVTLTRPSTSISATGDPIVDALTDLVEVAMRVSGLWDHAGTNMIDGYPARLGSWDEFVADLAVWSDHQARLRKVT